jgi:branched-chain amino acid aminotransferase
MSGWVNFNGSMKEEGMPLLTADSRALRYGDGLFETMRVANGSIQLKELHFDRLFKGAEILQMNLGTILKADLLEKQVLKTIDKNRIQEDARIRLMIFRGEGGLYETDGPGGGYIIQTWPLPPREDINVNGLVMGVYVQAKKHCDILANIKSNNYLLYAMAALHAKNNRWNDCLVLNSYGRVCDATIANVFWVKDKKIFTPPLSEGCVAGVMRRHLIETLPAMGYTVQEIPAEISDLETADELFLTNVISGIRWVREFNGKTFGNTISTALFRSTF